MKTFFLLPVFILVFSSFHIITPATKSGDTLTGSLSPEKIVKDSVAYSDSKKINDSITASYGISVLFYPGLKNKALLDCLYKELFTLPVYSKTTIREALKKKSENYFSRLMEDVKELGTDYAQEWDNDYLMQEVSRNNELVTVTLNYSGYSGGAHGYYSILYKILDLKQNKQVALADIFKKVPINWDKILRANIDRIEGGASDENGAVANSEMLLVDKIPATENFYLDRDKIVFVYNPYEITAYVAGIVEIPVSFKEVKQYLNPVMIKRLNLKL